MKGLNTLFAAFALLGASTLAQASEDTFASLTYGQTSDKLRKSGLLGSNLGHTNTDGILHKDGTWGVRLGRINDQGRYYATYDNASSDHSGLKLRRENLLGSYDRFLSLGDTTKLFGGASLGLTKLSQESSRYSRDTDRGYAVGLQAGVLQQLGTNASMELGYRYLRSNASVELVPHGQRKQGALRTSSSAQTYLAANYQF